MNKEEILIVNDPDGSYLGFFKKILNIKIFKEKDLEKRNPDIVVFTGGADVSPSLYFEKQGSKTSINKNRDEKEVKLLNRILENNDIKGFKKPLIIGICRGAQFLTVASGGKLIQHVTRHAISGLHKIDVKDIGEFGITSTHHQMMYPFNLDKNDFELIAWSSFFRSKTYLDGEDKEMELSKNFLESEIVFYKNINALAIQGHPEMSNCPEETIGVIKHLIEVKLNQIK